MNYVVKTIPLRGVVQNIGSVEFLSLEQITDPPSPIVIVHYAVNGKELTLGLRLDVDKGVFLDQIAGVEEEKLYQAAREIVDHLSFPHYSSLDSD